MSGVRFLRPCYWLLVRMHPAEFRERFGDEMLWIFEEERRRGALTALFVDGVLSLLRQRIRGEEETMVDLGRVKRDLGMAPRRIVEAGFAAFLMVGCFVLLLMHPGRVLTCAPGSGSMVQRRLPPSRQPLTAPSRVEPLAVAMTESPRHAAAGQINAAAADAVRFVRSQERAPMPGFCLQN